MADSGFETPPVIIEDPDFTPEYGLEAEAMLATRINIVGRALEHGERGWYPFAEGIAGSMYPDNRRKTIVCLMTLATQGLVESDLNNPNVLHVTEVGKQWYEQKQSERLQASAEPGARA